MVRSRRTIAVPPGATIKEQLGERHMTQKEFALRMGMSQKHISKLINGEVQLTPEVAMRLEMVLGVPAYFWNNLEIIYREKIIRAEAENALEQDDQIARLVPYNEIAKLAWVPQTRKTADKVIHLRKFFEVTQLNMLEYPLIPKLACRQSGEDEITDYVLITWVQKARLEARSIPVKPISLKKLTRLVPDIKRMTNKPLKSVLSKLRDSLADCGIALIVLPPIGQLNCQAATFYVGSKIVMVISSDVKPVAQFWLLLFKQIGHIILGHIDKIDCNIKCNSPKS